MYELKKDSSDLATADSNLQIPSYTDIADRYQTALRVVDDIVLKNYITQLSGLEVVPLNRNLLKNNIRDNVRFFKINEMVYEKDELAVHKFASVFNALAITDSSLFIIIDSDGAKSDFYMGVHSLDEYRTISSLKNTVKNAIKGQFPGIKICDDYTIEDMEQIIDHIKAKSISSVSCVANNKADENVTNKNFLQGLEKLVLSMQGEKYTGIIIAHGTSQAQLHELRKNYETIYTQLSAFAGTQINYVKNNSLNYSFAETSGSSHSETHTDNRSESTSKTETTGTSASHSESKGSAAEKVIGGVASAASVIGFALAPFTGGVSLSVGGVISGGLGILGSALRNSVTDSTSSNNSVSNSSSSTVGSSDGTTDSENYGTSQTEGFAKGLSEGMTLNLHDKSIENILARIDKQLKRIDEFESLGMYECAAYFLSDDQYAAEMAASTYKALMRGENSGVEISAINSWGQLQKDKTELIAQYIKNFIHPVFNYNCPSGNIEVTPCALVSGNELALHMGLPRKSVCGLPVIEYSDFGKEVVTYEGTKVFSGIKLGKVFNMGMTANNNVKLDLNSLAMHTFVTGSTGSGKSNTVYEIIRQLDNLEIKYLIIESAKGEYKNVFGMYPDVRVYGTNPKYTELLKINPFKFPKEIHILEHIDRLIEIFNVCWPMYAAMPAVLKEAVLKSYESCGWDLVESVNSCSDELFPTFADLLDELINVIQDSAYSEEVKSNYTGSLVTRIKSLTNGLNGQIFSADEIDSRELFNKKVIVDISRIGSAETKSLIMGILIMRLSEHRMSSSDGMNVPLQHVTVLEEAHNILKRTSTEQNSENANVAGKSVEMIANAIAEMRTYGEGFIIADQSPNAVDISAIRNTNTKIIMRLPDEQDRRLAGKSAGLKDEQIDEIAKLPKGVAVVYQNDWVEPVLCRIERFKGKEELYKKKPSDLYSFNNADSKKAVIRNLLRKSTGEPLDMSVGELTSTLMSMNISSKLKIKCIRILKRHGDCELSDISSIVYDLVCTPAIEKAAEEAESIDEWKNVFIYSGDYILADLEKTDQNNAVECILREQIERYNKPAEYLNIWNRFVKGEVM